jgi:hypothetical protein
MKPILLVFALLLTLSAAAFAQVHFNSGSAQPTNPQAATPDIPAKAKVKRKRVSVRCKDGTVSYSRQNVCTGHGSARAQSK